MLAGDPIAVASSGAHGDRRDVVCLIDGFLTEREELARTLGLSTARSDEDLAGEAYLRWGQELPGRLRGQFTIFVWQPALRRGLIARSRSGGRPMFVCTQGSTLYFASEVNDLLEMLPRRPAPDDVGIARVLGGWSLHDGRTLFDGVRRLDTGSLIELGDEDSSSRRYWRPRPPDPVSVGREEAIEEVRRLVGAAVSSRVGPHDEAGILLSGGLDSTTVAGIGEPALAGCGKSLCGYSAQFPDAPRADETPQLDSLASGLAVPQVRMALTGGSPLAAGIEYLQRWEMPLGATNHFVWQPFLRHAAENGVTVMFDGNGGDEVFSESPYLVADRLRRLDLIGAARLARSISGLGAGIRSASSSLYTWGVGGLLPTSLVQRGSAPDGPLFRDETTSLFQAGEEADPWREWEGPRWWAHRAHAIHRVPESFGAPEYQHRRATEAGLTAQHPLLDAQLVDFVLGLPPEFSFDPLFTRPLLRGAAAGLVPDEVRLKRGKAVFNSVFAAPLGRNDLPVIRDLLGSPQAEVNRFIHADVVKRHLLPGPAAHPLGEAAWAFQAWRLANVECWLRMQTEPAFLPDLLERAREAERGSRTFFNPKRAVGSA